MTKKLVLILLGLMAPVVLAKLPSTIDVCYRNDPQLDQCIIETVEKLRPILKTGDFGEGFKIIPLDPIHLEESHMGERDSGFYAAFGNITAYGGSDFLINKLKSNATSFDFDIDLTLPKIDFIGEYELQLGILLLYIRGQGDVSGTLFNTKAHVKLRGHRYYRLGLQYAKMDKIIIKANVGKLKIHFDNLFGGNQILGDIGNALINDHQDLYLHHIVPGFERTLGAKFLKVANDILKTAKYNELFPLI